MRQHQILTSKIFSKIVREEIERQFSKRYLTDQRLPDLYKRIPERELKDEVYSIFFKSFDDILETVGVNRNEKVKIRTYWHDTYDIVEWWNILTDNFPDKKFYEDERDNVKFEFNMWYLYFYNEGKKYVMRLADRIETIMNYILTKNIWEPAFEASRGLRQKTEEERHHDGYYEMDVYSYTKKIGREISRDLKSYEKQIWQPYIRSDSRDKDTIRIGTWI